MSAMHYLLLGEDSLAKDEKIEKIKRQVFSFSKDAASFRNALLFDYKSIQADKVNSEEFKKSLMELPAVAERRLLLLRNVHKLNNHNKDVLLRFLQEKHAYLVMIFDCYESGAKGALIKKLASYSDTFRFGGEQSLNVFDMTKSIGARNMPEAIAKLHTLFVKGDHPLQILGALIWYWGRNRSRVSKEKFHEGLKYLQEADLNIKRTRMNGENAVELAVVKLCSLTAC